MIIFLNGCSSSGKSTLGSAIQHLSEEPWLILGIDTFIKMMPSQYVGFGKKASEGFHFIPTIDNEGPLMHIESGEFGQRVSKSVPKVAQCLALDGHKLIIDEVLFEDNILINYVKALKNFPVYFIGLDCDLKLLTERELLRGDRAIGMSRSQVHRVHSPTRHYDLRIDTGKASPLVNAQQILNFVNQTPSPQSFTKLAALFDVS